MQGGEVTLTQEQSGGTQVLVDLVLLEAGHTEGETLEIRGELARRTLVVMVSARAGDLPAPRVVRLEDLEIDLGRYEVRRAGHLVDLTTKERELLVALARRDGELVRREDLAEEVWGCGLWPVNRSLDVHMSSLRRKLGDTAREPRYIQTVHGIGFRILH
jgi:two-component system alkaline phosphatase synthesis response regulator PhoP